MKEIPKIIHQIWISQDNSGQDIPESQKKYIESVKAKHPDWDYILWKKEDILQEFDAEALLARAANNAQRSDIARYMILHKFGGVYLDTDIEIVQSLDSLLEGRVSFGASEDGRYIAIAVLAAIPNLDLFESLVRSLPTEMGKLPTNIETGPVYFTKTLLLTGCEYFSILPPKTFYPFTLSTINDVNKDISDSCYTIHHYASSWTKNTSLFRRFIHKVNKSKS